MLLQLVVAVLVLMSLYNFYWKRKNLPPGPTPWPIFGNLLTMAKDEPGEAFRKWRGEYGSVYTYWLGELPAVAITDYETTVETLVKDGDAYAGRTDFIEFNELIRGGTYGVVMTEGELWRDQRRFALHVLRNFGLGKNLMQEKVLDEVNAMVTRIKNEIFEGHNEHNLLNQLDISVGSIINALLFGYRFEGEKLSEFLELKALLQNQMRDFASPIVMCMMKGTHFFKYIPVFRSMYYKLESNREQLYGFFRKQVDEHKANLDFTTDSEPMDYVEAFLREQQKRDQEGVKHSFTNIQLLNMCNDLWMAGQETTSNTIGWCMIYMIAHPEVQDKAHDELDRMIGSDRLITVADRSQLHYVNSIVHETQRLSNLVPHNAIHRTTRDVIIKGFRIPKDTSIVPQISAVLYDEKVFKNPTKFAPERFLDERGEFKKIDELIPFALGKRACLGEGLARMELFLFIANILNHFKKGFHSLKDTFVDFLIGRTLIDESTNEMESTTYTRAETVDRIRKIATTQTN